MTPVGIGIIGCGKVAWERHLPALAHLKDARVVAAAEPDAARLKSVADRFGIAQRFTDYRALLDRNDVDAIAVLTPTGSHPEIGLAALDAGKHVLMEKPLALTLDECDRLIAGGAHSTKKSVVCFNLRWHRLVRRARAFIATGALGRIKAIRSTFAHYRLGFDAPDWHRKLALGGGVTLNDGVHHFDLWRWLLGSEVTRIFAASTPSEYFEDETSTVSAQMANGALASAVFTFKTSPASEVEIYGEAGRLYLSCYRFDGLEFFPHSIYPGNIADRVKKTLAAVKELPHAIRTARLGGDFQSTFCGLWRHFLDCIRRDHPSECTLQDGKRAVEIALAAVKSASSGEPVNIQEAK